ncbi:MAG: hypothetical protein FJX23_10680, partial [Alphaproteobacteria bacterium]|nr:hypothetical protein [Alphaproteobacteria bacterium]
MNDSSVIRRSPFLAKFACLGAECEDTCCKGWSMQVDARTIDRYTTQSPELLDAVMDDGSGSFVMKRDAETDICVKLESGLCGIHAKLGSDFLGDACHFYPRVTRSIGSETHMTATLSCPEIVRLALAEDHSALVDGEKPERLPFTVKDYLPEGMDADAALRAHQAFLAVTHDASATPERIMARIVSATHSLSTQPPESWADAVPFFLKMADMRLPAPESAPADAFNLLHALTGIIVASRKPRRERLMATVNDMAAALAVTLDWQNAGIALSPNSAAALAALEANWMQHRAASDAHLRRWIGAQLSLALFPFAGFGEDMKSRIHIIAVRFATVRLA